jgi:hypothetical protein
VFGSIADITSSSKRVVAVRTLCSAAKNGDTCLDLKLLRALGTCVFRQLFAQLSSEVAHFTHLYYFEATSCSTFYPSCTLRAFLGLKRALPTGVVYGRDTSAKSDYREGVLLRPCFGSSPGPARAPISSRMALASGVRACDIRLQEAVGGRVLESGSGPSV